MSETTNGSPDAPAPVIPEFADELTEQDMLDLAVEHLEARMPEWTPRAGSQEIIFLEALVMLLTSLNYSISLVPHQVVEHVLRLHGITRDTGGPATAGARFEVAGSQGIYEIPAGTTVRVSLPDTEESVDFTTNGRLEISSGTGEGTVQITATEPGTRFNGIPEGTTLDVVDNLPFVERVTLDSETVGGRDTETDTALESRAASRFGRMTSTLVAPDHFQLAALELAEVGRARVIDVYDPTNPDTDPGDDTGHVTVAVADNDGQALGETEKTGIRDALAEQALASLIIHVVDPDYTDLDIEVTVKASVSADPEQVQADVVQALAWWLSPARWAWGGDVTQFALVAEVASVPGVAEVITAPSGFELSGVAPLPRVDTITVTVEEAD